MRINKIVLCSSLALAVTFAGSLLSGTVASAQQTLPADDGLATYHTSPRYRDSESHPLRIVAYALHPVGWLLREVIFRPFSYFASSTETTRSVLGFREPYDYRQPECFSSDDSAPDCRSIAPFNYDSAGAAAEGAGAAVAEEPKQVALASSSSSGEVYFPDVNFDFDRHSLNDLGRGRVRQIAELLKQNPNLKVVLQGHTDYKGKNNYNEKLGMNRAEAVKQELVSLGVSGENLSTVTFGQSQPIFKEEADWARAVNRRVAIQSGDTVHLAMSNGEQSGEAFHGFSSPAADRTERKAVW